MTKGYWEEIKIVTYDHLLKYKRYFENEAEKAVKGYKYGNKLFGFIDEFHKSVLFNKDYITYLEANTEPAPKPVFDENDDFARFIKQCEATSKRKPLENYIDNADIEMLSALLTYYVRAERFNDGLWFIAIRKKIFLRCLLRLEKLIK